MASGSPLDHGNEESQGEGGMRNRRPGNLTFGFLSSRSMMLATTPARSRTRGANHGPPRLQELQDRDRDRPGSRAKIRAKSKTDGPDGDLVGGFIRFPAADSYAEYVVTSVSPLTLAHVDVMDGWRALPATIRGLRMNEARQMVESDRKTAAVFGR